MNNSNWMGTLGASINDAAPAPTGNADDALRAHDLKAAVNAGAFAGRDLDFAKSLLEGYVKFGSFTDRQRPFVERLLHPVPNTDGPLAEALLAAVEAGLLVTGDAGFAKSLLAGFAQYGRFTDKQRPFVVRLVESAERARELAANLDEKAPQIAQATTSAAPGTVVAGQPSNASGAAAKNICATVNLDKFSRFTVGKLQLSLKNDGSLIWVKWDGKIAGSIDSATGQYRETRRYLSRGALDEVLAELVRIEYDPMAAARSNGILTGRCSCCGRPLTDPESIAFGIGPVCRSRGWGL